MVNQDAHKFLRRNKPGIRLSEVTPAPENFKRPVCYQSPKVSPPGSNYYQDLQNQMARYLELFNYS